MTQAERTRDWELRKKYGISLETYRAIYAEQEGKCAICQKECPATGHNGLHVDHCHRTKCFRKLICGRCNYGLGYVDNREWLVRALNYIDEFESRLSGRGSGTVYKQKGSRFWWIQYYRNGKRHHVSSRTEDHGAARVKLNLLLGRNIQIEPHFSAIEALKS